jgi:hypothetical protein
MDAMRSNAGNISPPGSDLICSGKGLLNPHSREHQRSWYPYMHTTIPQREHEVEFHHFGLDITKLAEGLHLEIRINVLYRP